MALVRILVDGYSLLHNLPELAAGRPRHCAAARDALVRWLTRYHDATGTPITVFFDGAGARKPAPETDAPGQIEVLFSRSGKTADQMIERAVHRFRPYGEVLAVTDDRTEGDLVIGLGGMVSSCAQFASTAEAALAELADDVNHHNRTERNRFRRGHHHQLA